MAGVEVLVLYHTWVMFWGDRTAPPELIMMSFIYGAWCSYLPVSEEDLSYLSHNMATHRWPKPRPIQNGGQIGSQQVSSTLCMYTRNKDPTFSQVLIVGIIEPWQRVTRIKKGSRLSEGGGGWRCQNGHEVVSIKFTAIEEKSTVMWPFFFNCNKLYWCHSEMHFPARRDVCADPFHSQSEFYE